MVRGGSGSRRQASTTTTAPSRGSGTRGNGKAVNHAPRGSRAGNHGSGSRATHHGSGSSRTNHGSGSSRANHGSGSRAHHGSGSRNGRSHASSSSSSSSSTTTTTTTTASSSSSSTQRATHASRLARDTISRIGHSIANHGSSTSGSSSSSSSERGTHASHREARDATTTRSSSSSHRGNHGSSARRHESSSSSTTTTTTRTSNHHGSGSHHEPDQHESASQNHRHGRHNHHHGHHHSGGSGFHETADEGPSLGGSLLVAGAAALAGAALTSVLSHASSSSSSNTTNGRSGNRGSRTSTSTATATRSQTSNHARTTTRTTTTTTTTPTSSSNNRVNRTSTSTTATRSQTSNHGSGTARTTTRTTTTTTSTPTRSNRGSSGTHRYSRAHRVVGDTYYVFDGNDDDEDEDCDCCYCCDSNPLWSIPFGMVVSLVLFLILLRNSAIVDYDNYLSVPAAPSAEPALAASTDASLAAPGGAASRLGGSSDNLYHANVWTLFGGQTQRIGLPWFVRGVDVTVTQKDPSVAGATVWKSSKCPPLDGPPAELRHDFELDLEPQNYVYDYYRLNPGSSVDVRLDQLAGSTRLYLLKGALALEDLDTGLNLDPHHWETIAVASAAAHAGKRRYLHYTTDARKGEWSVDHDNVYTLLYDNPSGQLAAAVNVQTDLVSTTHDVRDSHEVCDLTYGKTTCYVPAAHGNCLVVEHVSGNKDTALQYNDDDGHDDDEESLTIRVDVYRNWKTIAIVSIMPVLVSLVVYLGCRVHRWCCRNSSGRSQASEGNDEETLLDPLLPPATAPHAAESTAPPADAEPSAPPCEDPSVEPVPVPDEARAALTSAEATATAVLVVPADDVEVVDESHECGSNLETKCSDTDLV